METPRTRPKKRQNIEAHTETSEPSSSLSASEMDAPHSVTAVLPWVRDLAVYGWGVGMVLLTGGLIVAARLLALKLVLVV